MLQARDQKKEENLFFLMAAKPQDTHRKRRAWKPQKKKLLESTRNTRQNRSTRNRGQNRSTRKTRQTENHETRKRNPQRDSNPGPAAKRRCEIPLRHRSLQNIRTQQSPMRTQRRRTQERAPQGPARARAGTTGAGARGNFVSASRHEVDAARNRQDARCKSIHVQTGAGPRPWLVGRVRLLC